MFEIEGQDAVQVAVQLVTASWKGAHYLQRLCGARSSSLWLMRRAIFAPCLL